MHSLSEEAFFLRKSKASIVELLYSDAVDIRRKKIKKRREALKKIARIVAVLVKQRLAFRGQRHEGAHEINDPTVDHGNFIDTVKLVAASDAVLKEHIDNAEIASKKAVEKRKKGRPGDKPGKHGRGSLVTFLSGDFTTKIMRNFKDFIEETIISEVKEIFSLEVDTTQDSMAHDKCAIIIRYVHNGDVHERLLSVIKQHLLRVKHFLILSKAS